MSKEPTPLQALERIGELKVGCHYEKCAFLVIDFLKDSYDYKIIETALKEYEGAKNHIKALNEERIENSLKLKALEIIKEHRLDIDWFLQFVEQDISYQHYVYCVEQGDNKFAKRFLLSEEEYELLKEILK